MYENPGGGTALLPPAADAHGCTVHNVQCTFQLLGHFTIKNQIKMFHYPRCIPSKRVTS